MAIKTSKGNGKARKKKCLAALYRRLQRLERGTNHDGKNENSKTHGW